MRAPDDDADRTPPPTDTHPTETEPLPPTDTDPHPAPHPHPPSSSAANSGTTTPPGPSLCRRRLTSVTTAASSGPWGSDRHEARKPDRTGLSLHRTDTLMVEEACVAAADVVSSENEGVDSGIESCDGCCTRLFAEDGEEVCPVGAYAHLRIISINDVYCLTNLPRTFNAIKQYKEACEAAGGTVLVVLPGDFLAPSLLSSINSGAGMCACLAHMGFDIVTLGNHEADVSFAELARRVADNPFMWLNTNVHGLADKLHAMHGVPPHKMPELHSVWVKANRNGCPPKKAGLFAVLTPQKGLYKEGAFMNSPILDVVGESVKAMKSLAAQECDVVIGLTHQYMHEDRLLASALAELSDSVSGQTTLPPASLFVGGHDHVAMHEKCGGGRTTVIKAGCDSTHIAVSDVVWSSETQKTPAVTCRLIDVAPFPEDESLAELVAQLHASLADTFTRDLLPVPTDLGRLTSVAVRGEQCSIGTLLTSAIRDSCGADLCMYPAGSIRRGHLYPEGLDMLTVGDLYSELAFDDDAVVVKMPGSVILGVVRWSRHYARHMGGFLQLCDQCSVDDSDDESLLRIGGVPVSPFSLYSVATCAPFLKGMDSNEPLCGWLDSFPRCKGPLLEERGKVKALILQLFGLA